MTVTMETLCALSRLLPREREVLVDHALVGLSVEQIAKKDEISTRAVYLVLDRARERLVSRGWEPAVEAERARAAA